MLNDSWFPESKQLIQLTDISWVETFEDVRAAISRGGLVYLHGGFYLYGFDGRWFWGEDRYGNSISSVEGEFGSLAETRPHVYYRA